MSKKVKNGEVAASEVPADDGGGPAANPVGGDVLPGATLASVSPGGCTPESAAIAVATAAAEAGCEARPMPALTEVVMASTALIPSYQFTTPGGNKGLMFTGFDPSTEAGKVAVANATIAVDVKGDEYDGQEIGIVNVVMFPAESIDEKTGEERRYVRCVLVTADGTMIGWGSDGVASSVMMLSRLFGPPPWSPAIKVVPKRKVARVGHWKYLRIIGR